LAPGQARDAGGRLTLGAIPAEHLADAYGTPLLVIDLAVVDSAIDELTRSAQAYDFEISYAAKAFATIEFIRHVAARGIGLDVCSLGELITAERAGFPARRITLHGAGKTDEELAAACAGRLGFIVVDGVEELARLTRLARDGSCAQLILRLNVGIEAHTHAFVRTGGDDTKFGIHPRDESTAASMLRESPATPLAGLHTHIGSQICDVEPYLATATALVAAAERFARRGLPVRRLVIGGGFGVQTRPESNDESLDVLATIRAVAERVAERARASGIPVPRIGIEPGRALIGAAGTTLYRVLAVKRQSSRTFVVVDGGIAENPRPALYGARHHVLTAGLPVGDEEVVTLCGRSCENDELGVVALPSGVQTGDLLAMCATGAYTYSMAGNYNRFPRPAVVGVSNGSHRRLALRESIDDVLRNDAVEQDRR
jgi:diaminopimelate decarboxylase